MAFPLPCWSCCAIEEMACGWRNANLGGKIGGLLGGANIKKNMNWFVNEVTKYSFL